VSTAARSIFAGASGPATTSAARSVAAGASMSITAVIIFNITTD
jgi:hypothetical protein